MTSFDLDAHLFSRAYVNVSNAYNPTKGDAALTRTILIEAFPSRGIQLVATDGTLLMRQFVPLESRGMHDEPTSDEAPDESWIVQDPDKLGLALAKVIYSHSKAEADETGISNGIAQVSINALIRADAPVFEGMEPLACTIAFGEQRTQLPVLDMNYPKWRSMTTAEYSLPDAVDSILISPRTYGRLARLKGIESGVSLQFIGNNRPVLFVANDAAGAPIVRGIIQSMTREVKKEMPGSTLIEGQQEVDFSPKTIDPTDPDVIDPFGDDDDIDLGDL